MKIEVKTIDEYFIKTDEREQELRVIDKLIRDTAPKLPRVLFANMGGGAAIGYGIIPYQSSSMKQPGQWPILALANQKNYMALYVCALTNGKYIAETRKDELGKISVGRSCIRFKKVSDLNLGTVKSIVKDLERRYEIGEKLFS